MSTLTITNSFHNTESTVRPQPAGPGRAWISNAAAARCCRILCGRDGCTCGGNLGERPALETVPDSDGKGWIIYLGGE